MLPQFYTFSHGLCLNNFLKVWLIVNQRYQFPLFRYMNQANGVSHIVRGVKCWEKYINGKSINIPLMHAKRTHYGMCWKKCFILYVHISHGNRLMSIDTSV